MKLVKSIVFCVLAVSALYVGAETLEQRVAPVGKICMAGDECAAAGTSLQVASADGAPRSGEQVYTSKCATCHATGAAGAPKLGDVASWSARVDKGMDTLYTHAIKGFNGMPAKGLCFDCSDDEIKASVDHLVNNSK